MSAERAGLLVIPVGYIAFTFSLTPARGLKWSFITRKPDLPVIVDMQKIFIEAYPEANSLIFQGLLEVLENELRD
jgi:isochorismate hydrolase